MAREDGLLRGLYDRLRLNLYLNPGVLRFAHGPMLAPYYDARRRHRSIWRLTGDALAFVVFTRIVIPLRARKVARRWNWGSARRRQAVAIGRRAFADPLDIALYDIADAAEMKAYVRRFEHIGISRMIANPATDHDPAIIDKARFAETCRHHGLPHPATLAFRPGAGSWQVHALPKDDRLIVKPVTGSGGSGIVALEAPAGAMRDPNSLTAWLDDTVGEGPQALLLQPRLQPHADLRLLAMDALPTLRIVTMLDEQGRPEAVATVTRFAARAGVVTDNLHTGGLTAGIDHATGRLGVARYGNAPGVLHRHPHTGAPITGAAVPFWKEALDLAVAAHAAAFPRHVQLGWDIAIGADGPILIEANARPNPRTVQRGMGQGIGDTRYGVLIQHHLRRRIGDGPPPRLAVLRSG